MVSEENKLVKAIQPAKFDAFKFKSEDTGLVVPNLSGITGNKDAMNKLTLQKVTDNGATTTNNVVFRANAQLEFRPTNDSTNNAVIKNDSATGLALNVYCGSGAGQSRFTGGGLVLGSTTIAGTACLDVQSTTKGVLLPRMTTAQKNAIGSPASGLIVFDTDLDKLCVYTGAAWETITSA